jgi:serine phosphatase RsbU (regulator of sigma subunit)
VTASIRFISGSRKGTTTVIEPGKPQRLGRDPACELLLEEGNVSRQHARIGWQDGKLVVENLGSTNGIYVNGAKHERADLRLWDVVVVGGSAFRVEALATPSHFPVNSTEVGDGDRMRTLLQCLLAMQRILGEDAERLIERSLETLFMALPATRLSLFSISPDGDPVQGFTATRSGAGTAHMSHGFARKVLAAGRAILLSEQEATSADWGATLQEQHVLTILGVPVKLAGRITAVLLCDNLEQPGQLDQSHVPILEFAGQALEHVFQRDELRQLEVRQARADHEYLAAKKVQNQIFTKDPRKIPGPMRWTALYQPALELGGDFYDFSADEAGITWLVADVSGKGVPAALVVSMLKAFCKTLYPQRLSPLRFLIALNDLFTDELPGGMFFTGMMARVEGDELRWCSVGHPPGILLRSDGTVTELEVNPGMLGMFPEALLDGSCHEHRMRIGAGDRLIFYTDGVTEAMDPDGALFNVEGLRRAMAATRGSGLEQALANLLDAVAVFRRGTPLEDDITIVMGDR